MPVNQQLDVTPDFSFSTIQFNSEVANAIVASLLTVFILINIGSAVSKLIYCTRGKSFDFDSWNRSFIFANSDDPIRIISWMSHNYVYREKGVGVERYRNKLKLQRLLLPLSARIFILVASIASVAVSIPGDKQLSGCENGDYQLRFDPQAQGKANILNRACFDIPMTSRLGQVTSVASYCTCPVLFDIEDSENLEGITRVIVVKYTSGRISTIIYGRGIGAGSDAYVQWDNTRNSNEKGVYFYSDLGKLDQRVFLDIVVRAIRRESGEECPQDFNPQPGTITGSFFVDLNCSVYPVDLIKNVEAYVRNAMQWTRLEAGEKEVRIRIDTTEANPQPKPRGDCPISVNVTRPIVNILPLGLMLLLLVVVNLVVSFATSAHGNALDAGFHLIKETLGHDTTSNPLEENEERKEVVDLDLRNWRCGVAGAHIGFIGRDGDVPVKEFDSATIVCGCSQVVVELEQAAALDDVPAVSVTAPMLSQASFIPQHEPVTSPSHVPPSTGPQWQGVSESNDGSQTSHPSSWPSAPPAGPSPGQGGYL